MTLNTENLWFRYKKDWVIKGFTAEFKKGEITGLTGPNGSGKTTLLRLLCRILLPQKGKVSLGNKDIKELSRKELSKHVTLVPQIFQPVYPYKVDEVVKMGTYPHQEKRITSEEAMDLTGITEIKEKVITSLSGGELRMVLLTKAIAQNTDFLLLDEPFAHLDRKHIDKVEEVIYFLKDRGKGVIIVSHERDYISIFDISYKLGERNHI